MLHWLYAPTPEIPKESGLLSLEQGHPSTGKMPFGGKDSGNRRNWPFLQTQCEVAELILGEGMEKALQKHNGFPKAGIQVAMGAIQDAPFSFRQDVSGIF